VKGLKTVSDIPINKPEIRTLIPHSGLMCLLDSVTGWDDQSIICISNTHRDPANPLRAMDDYRPCMLLNTCPNRCSARRIASPLGRRGGAIALLGRAAGCAFAGDAPG